MMNNDLIERMEKYLNTIPDDMRYTSPNDFVRMLDESLTALREQEGMIEQQGICYEFQVEQIRKKQARITELEERLRCWHEAIKDQGE